MTKERLILVVDDEADIRQSIKSILEDEDYKVETAVDGRDCLKKLSKNKPDLVLLDILMPGMVTKDITKKLREKYPKLPIIFVTVVKLSEAAKGNLIKGNMVDYVEKPFNNSDLIKKVKKALERYG